MTFTHQPAPAYHPVRDPSWLSEGEEIRRTARLLGRELMPWQQRAVDVATEYRLDAFGQRHYRYTRVLITVPRQSGKTTLVGPVQLHRILTRPHSTAFFTAQTGQDAKKRMKDLIELVESSPAAPLFRTHLAAGSEGLSLPGNGSSLTRFSPTLSALHGETPLLVSFDEIWKYTLELGTALLGAASPGQITLGARAQIWMISTMGTLDSEFMNEWVKAGRAGTDPTLCYIEYSMPEGADPYDPATWWLFHPALGNTITEESLQKETGLPKSEWMRAYMNRLTATERTVIDLDIWDDLAMSETPGDPNHVLAPPRSSVALALEVAPDNAAAAVLAGWRDPDTGRPCVRVVHQAPGTAWLVDYFTRLVDEWRPAAIAADGAGPVSRFVPEVNAALVELSEQLQLLDGDPLPEHLRQLQTTTVQEFGAAWGTLLAAARDERVLLHDGSEALRDAVAALEVRTTNGVTKPSRDHSPRPIAAVVGAALALWAHDHQPTTVGGYVF